MNSNNQKNIQEYIDYLARKGYNIEVSIEGLLGVVKNHGVIIFTTAGLQSSAVIEAFLGGMVYTEEKLKNELTLKN